MSALRRTVPIERKHSVMKRKQENPVSAEEQLQAELTKSKALSQKEVIVALVNEVAKLEARVVELEENAVMMDSPEWGEVENLLGV